MTRASKLLLTFLFFATCLSGAFSAVYDVYVGTGKTTYGVSANISVFGDVNYIVNTTTTYGVYSGSVVVAVVNSGGTVQGSAQTVSISSSDGTFTTSNLVAPSSTGNYFVRAVYTDVGSVDWSSKVPIIVSTNEIDRMRVQPNKAGYYAGETITLTLEAVRETSSGDVGVNNTLLIGTLRYTNSTIISYFQCTTDTTGACTNTSLAAPTTVGKYNVEINNYTDFTTIRTIPFDVRVNMKDETGSSMTSTFVPDTDTNYDATISVSVSYNNTRPSNGSFSFTANITNSLGTVKDTVAYSAANTIMNRTNNFIASYPINLNSSKYGAGTYKVDVEVKIKNASSRKITGNLGIKLFERYDGPAKDTLDIRRLITNVNSEIDRVDFSDLENKEDVKKGDIGWIALENKYFINAILTEDGSGLTVRTDMKEDGLVSSTLEDEGISVDPGKEDVIKYTFYSGPKDLNIMKGIGKGLEGAIDLGWFHVIAEPLLRFLKFIYSFTGNYGYAVILVTLIIKIIFFPLANKSYKSMKEMQKLQPQMAELREKYKDEKEKMSKEIMELYRKNRVNPLSGCLPMIVQIPVFIALYNVLMNAIELRHAPFHFWIVDMSTKDPYYVTPLIMGLTMFLQQKMSPSAPDPTQQKVMMYGLPFLIEIEEEHKA